MEPAPAPPVNSTVWPAPTARGRSSRPWRLSWMTPVPVTFWSTTTDWKPVVGFHTASMPSFCTVPSGVPAAENRNGEALTMSSAPRLFSNPATGRLNREPVRVIAPSFTTAPLTPIVTEGPALEAVLLAAIVDPKARDELIKLSVGALPLTPLTCTVTCRSVVFETATVPVSMVAMSPGCGTPAGDQADASSKLLLVPFQVLVGIFRSYERR